MSYASQADLEERLGTRVYVQLTDDAGTGLADAGKAAEALGAAEGEVNSYLGRRYAVPVEVGGEEQLAALLKGITLDLAEYRLHARRSPVPEDVRRKQQAALRWLQRAAAGRVVLPAGRVVRRNTTVGPGAVVAASQRVLTREELEDA